MTIGRSKDRKTNEEEERWKIRTIKLIIGIKKKADSNKERKLKKRGK
jgi:hypothetical protein